MSGNLAPFGTSPYEALQLEGSLTSPYSLRHCIEIEEGKPLTELRRMRSICL